MSETEPTCETCHKPLSSCTCVHIISEKKDEGSETKEELREKLEEREQQLGLIAVKSFEDEKTAFLSQIKDEDKRKDAERRIGDDPDKLENAKLMASIISAGIKEAGGHIKGYDSEGFDKDGYDRDGYDREGREKKAPSGARISPPQESSGKEGTKETIDELFKILESPSSSPKERDMANSRINELYSQAKAGWQASGQKNPSLLPTMQCPKCSNVMHGIKCYTCGYEIPKIQQDKPFK